MNIALLGYGKMGKAIEAIALERGHAITLKTDKNTQYNLEDHTIDVAIDFSIPETATTHITSCLENHIPIVSGTTGWLENYATVTALCKQVNGAFLYASNFSIGVTLFFELNKKLGQLMGQHKSYQVAMEEIHHTQKLDAPSGTAITLAEGIIDKTSYTNWKLVEDADANAFAKAQTIPIYSKREGIVPGTHTVTYDSPIDQITIKHEAHSRQGFALGAVIAAEWLVGKKGVFSMQDVLNIS